MKSSTSLVLILFLENLYLNRLLSGGCPLRLGPSGVVVDTSGEFNLFHFQSFTISFSNKVEPVVQSVILVERTAVGGATAQASSAEEVENIASRLIIQNSNAQNAFVQ